MDAALLRALQRLGRAADVPFLRACERADDRTLDLLGDSAHGHEIVPRGGRKAGLDHVHAEAGEHMGNSELIGDVHVDARRLLAVAGDDGRFAAKVYFEWNCHTIIPSLSVFRLVLRFCYFSMQMFCAASFSRRKSTAITISAAGSSPTSRSTVR